MKRKNWLIFLIVLLVLAGAAFGGYNLYRYPAMLRNLSDHTLSMEQTENLKNEILSKASPRILVTYFSYSGTTKNIAESLSEKTGADIFEIVPQETYSNVYPQSNREIRSGDRPVLSQSVENIAEYDIVFVGYPVWWHATPAPVNSFLENHDLQGKLVIPFCTSGESDIEETLPTFKDSCSGIAVYGGKRITGSAELDGWLAELGIQSDRTQQSENVDDNVQNIEVVEDTDEGNSKTLIVYFSWSLEGNTETMANYIGEQTSGDILELDPLNPYPEDYDECVDIALEERDSNVRPKIKNLPDSISEYDRIFVGYPIWWHTAPMIIGTFLENYDLSGVAVYPFAQSASMDIEQFENSMEFVRENAAGAMVYDGLFVEAADTEAIQEYLSVNGFSE